MKLLYHLLFSLLFYSSSALACVYDTTPDYLSSYSLACENNGGLTQGTIYQDPFSCAIINTLGCQSNNFDASGNPLPFDSNLLPTIDANGYIIPAGGGTGGTGGTGTGGTAETATTCQDSYNQHLLACDTTMNVFNFLCVNDLITGLPSVTTSCIAKDNSGVSSPCDTVTQKKIAECNALGQNVSGKCTDNGIDYTSTYICVNRAPNCLSSLHQKLDSVNNVCICDTGFILNSLGDCSIPLFPTDTNLSTAQQAQQNEANIISNSNSQISSQISNTNSNLDSIANAISNTNNKLTGVRHDISNSNKLLKNLGSDMNKSNSLLSEIAGKNNSDVGSISISNITNAAAKSATTVSDIRSAVTTLSTDFDTMKSRVSQGFSSTPMNTGVNPNFDINFHGTNVSFDLCQSFGRFYPVLYFVFTIYFTFIGLRFFVLGFKVF
jgi:hypothetical protein